MRLASLPRLATFASNHLAVDQANFGEIDIVLSDPRVTQIHPSGIMIRQDFRDCVRFMMFQTDDEDWQYATHGGTGFVVCHKGRYFGVTCRPILGDFNWRQIVFTDRKFGKIRAGLKSAFYASGPTGQAVASDILDILVVEFSADSGAAFFKSNAFLIGAAAIGPSKTGDRLAVNGALKDQSKIDDKEIVPVFALLEFTDQEPAKYDPALRKAMAQYDVPRLIATYGAEKFENLLGISGSPVFNQTRKKLCGIAVRGGLNGDKATIWYVDIFDVLTLLDAIVDDTLRTTYLKNIVRLETIC